MDKFWERKREAMKISSNKRGMVMAYVMVIGLFLVLLVSALVFAVNITSNVTKNSALQRRAYINARSGVEAAKAYIQKDVYGGVEVVTDFYIYGTPDALQYMKKSQFEASGIDGTSFEVFALCSGDTEISPSALPGGGSGLKAVVDFTVISTGRNATAQPYKMAYEGILELYYSNIEPLLPGDFNEGGDATQGWYSPPSGGRAEFNSGAARRIIDGTAVFPYPTYVKDNSSKDYPLMARKILFTHSAAVNSRPAFEVEKNKSVSLSANYFAFYGDIAYPDRNNNTEFIIMPCQPSLNPAFTPLTNATELASYGISGLHAGKNYGIIYFGPDVKCDSVNYGLASGTFYLFPENTDLSRVTGYGSTFGRNSLIKITDLSIISEISNGEIGFTFTDAPEFADMGGEFK